MKSVLGKSVLGMTALGMTALGMTVGIYASGVYAAQTEAEFGLTYSQTYYIEPDIMEQHGQLFGLNASFSQRQNATVMLDVEYSAGWVDYKGSGTMENIPDTLFESRVLLGKDVGIGRHYRLTPYVGLGYRFLTDDSTGMVTTDGSGGYRREQSYVYAPIGLMLSPAYMRTATQWQVGVVLEYDHFLYGNNMSGISSVCGGTDSYVSQSEGQGARAALRLYSPQVERRGRVIMELFYRGWEVEDSTSNSVYVPRCYSNPPYQSYYEPHNRSEQWGMRFIWRS